MLSLLAKAVGGKALKGLLAIWMKDESVLFVAAETAIDSLEKHSNGYIEKRKTRRLVEQIEEEILEGLASYLESEFRSMRKGDKISLVEKSMEYVASKTFYDLCFEEALDPARIIARSEDVCDGFARELVISDKYAARTIFNFAITKYLSILGSLPTFSDDTLRTILRDTDEVLERIKNIEIELKTFEVRTREEMEDDERNFRRMLSRKLRQLDVFGVDSRELTKRYDLSIAYINLTLSRDVADPEATPYRILGDAASEGTQLIVIQGDPGSGKTTLLSWLALKCAEKHLPSELDAWSAKLPIFLVVREYADKELPTGRDLLVAQFGAAGDSFTADWIQSSMRTGNFIFFVDGYDEVAESKRADVSKWVRELLSYYEKSVVVVSTRPYANCGLTRLSEEFGSPESTVSVEPMSQAQVSQFIENWYAAYTANADTALRSRLALAKERLLARIISNSSLRSLIKNPLLCSLICFVSADRDGFVPDQRGELYLLATETLLDRRDRERGVVHTQDINLTKLQKFKLLGYVAEYFFQRRSVLLATSDVVNRLKEYLPSLGLASEDAEEVVVYLSERSHILRCPSASYVDFSHKTFLEYFYARRITEKSLIEEVSARFFEDDFREVVLFTFSIASAQFAEAVLEKIIKRISKFRSESEEVNSAILILQTAIRQSAEISPDYRRMAIDLLSRVLPPKNNEDADQLSQVGDVIFEPLKDYAKPQYQSSWRHIVSALLHTFSDDAVYTLVLYAKLGDPTVDKILLNGRRCFESNLYRDLVISECRTVRYFEVSDWGDLELVSKLPIIDTVSVKQFGDDWSDATVCIKPKVLSLEINGAYAVKDLSILRSFPNIRTLSIQGCDSLDDFSAISGCKELRNLQLYSFSVDRLDFLRGLRHLEHLDLSECTELTDVRILNSLSQLKELSLPYSHLFDQITLDLTATELELDQDFFDVWDPFDADFSAMREELSSTTK